MEPPGLHPSAEYVSRRDRWRSEQNTLHRRFISLGNWRLAIGVIEAGLACLVFIGHFISIWSLLPLVLAFAVLLVWHSGVTRRRAFAGRAIRYYEDGIARLGDAWQELESSGDQFRETSHVYAEDLDVFGKGSLFQLIARARTAAGEQTLANWLLSPAGREEVLSRQEALRELSARLDLRETLALLGEDVRAGIHPAALEQWCSAPPVVFAPALRAIAMILVIAGLVALAGFLVDALPRWLFLTILCVNFIFIAIVRKRVARVIEAIQTPAADLRILSLILERLEREAFESSKLEELRAILDVDGLPASKRLARLARWIELLDSADHLLIRVIGPLILWREQVVMGIEAWRRENGPRITLWIRAVGEFEALSSLASLAFERPEWSFPILTEDMQPCFEGQGLQHPLMSPRRCIPNDIELTGDLRLLIVSGSNMSGKSTLLRSIGLNSVLAWAGAPVAAKQLRISALQPGASIRVVDSLQDNRSRFFAEITRIRQIVDLTRTNGPVLFLLDELLSGTNSHDRRIGASAIVRSLVGSGAIGLITTHDLALANIQEDLGSRAANVHFDDQITEGKIEFDYRLRPGVVTRSNALELMRAVGLQV